MESLENSKVSVLITGVGGGSLGREIIKSFKISPHNYKIVTTDILANSTGLFETPNKYLVPPAHSTEYIDTLLKICKKERIDVIVGGSEPEIEQIARNAHIFEDSGIKILSNPWPIIEKCADKYSVISDLSSHGISCPTTFLYDEKIDLEIESYPVIIKPRKGSGSRNVFIANDRDEVNFFCRYLKKYGSEPLIQEYVGSFDEEFTIGILYANNGKLITSIAMKRILEGGLSTRQISQDPLKKEKYVVSSGISQGVFEDFKSIRLMGEKIAKILDVNGPVNIQCRNTKSGIIPFEINPRFSGTVACRSIIGYNEPDILCRYKMFNEIPDILIPKYGYVMRDLTERYISFNDVKQIPTI